MTTVAAPPLDFGSAELRAGTTRVVVVPALGGKIVSLELGGREWLWRSRTRAERPADGASYDAVGDTGGIDECFPTTAPCVLPSTVARYGGLALPDHGELWSQPSTFSLETRDDGMAASCAWQGRRMAYRFVRNIMVRASGQVDLRYAVTNDGRVPLPFVWSAHAVFPLGKDTRVGLADGTRARVWSARGIEIGGPGAELRWPRVVAKDKMLDLSLPDAVARAYAYTVYVDGARATLEQDGARLEVAVDGAPNACMSVSVDKPAWSPFRRGAHRVVLAPSIGAPASLTEAMGPWHAAASVEPGATLEWIVRWRSAA